jgi:lysophospholipase L1-like esterase
MAKDALSRVDKQVLVHDPDLVIVCFGLNDVNGPLEEYLDSLRQIFSKCVAAGVDTIFMSPNMLNTRVAPDAPQKWAWYAVETAKMQNEGKMDRYMESAMNLAREMGVRVCDCYSKWKELEKAGEDITMLLVNRINHPTSEMHKLFADELYKMIIGEEECFVENSSGMYQGEVNQAE